MFPGNPTNNREINMPLITVKLIENVFSPEQKKQIITKLTDAMVSSRGAREPLRQVTWVVIEETKEGNWAIGGQPLHARDVHRMQQPAA